MIGLFLSDLKEKTRDELEDMLIERQDNLLFGYKMLSRGEAIEEDLRDQFKEIEQEIDVIERKLKRRKR